MNEEKNAQDAFRAMRHGLTGQTGKTSFSEKINFILGYIFPPPLYVEGGVPNSAPLSVSVDRDGLERGSITGG